MAMADGADVNIAAPSGPRRWTDAGGWRSVDDDAWLAGRQGQMPARPMGVRSGMDVRRAQSQPARRVKHPARLWGRTAPVSGSRGSPAAASAPSARAWVLEAATLRLAHSLRPPSSVAAVGSLPLPPAAAPLGPSAVSNDPCLRPRSSSYRPGKRPQTFPAPALVFPPPSLASALTVRRWVRPRYLFPHLSPHIFSPFLTF